MKVDAILHPRARTACSARILPEQRVDRTKRMLAGLVLAAALMAPYRMLAAAPAVDNASGASNVLAVSAVLNGTLTSTGGVPTQVYAYWGETDGGTTVENWDHTNDLGTNTVGPLSLAVTNLVPNTMYYYRFYATNVDGEAWAPATTNFQTLVAAGPAPIDLKSCSTFAILAGASITDNGGGGTINGDVGLDPGSAQGIPPSLVNGTIHVSDAISSQAQLDLTAAYLDAEGRSLNQITVSGNIGGLTLAPGLYWSTSSLLITGDLTLDAGGDANAVWLFQMGSTLTTADGAPGNPASRVILAGGAQAKNIFWQVGSSATLGTYSIFKGTILALTSITMDVGSVTEGRALARNGTVAFLGNGSSSLPNVTLTIISEHGTGTPPVGVHTNIYGATLTNSVTGEETLLGGSTQYVATGWSMTGNGPAASGGTGTNMVMALTNSVTLTWQWNTNYLLNASNGPNGNVSGDTNGFYAAGSNVVVTAVPDPGYQFADWTGNVSGPATTNSVLSLTMDQARTVVAHFTSGSSNVVLEIISLHGTGTPATGVYVNVSGSLLTNSITLIELMGGTQYVNTGWSMIGNGPESGLTNGMSMTHTNDAVLTWLWTTNYLLNASAVGSGLVTGDTNGFYASGSNVTVTAVPGLDASFAGWTGDLSGLTNDLTQIMTMDQARTVVAHFTSGSSNVELEIISRHGTGTPATGVYVNVSGSLLTNSITPIETMGGTQYVNTGWSMIGNDPESGVTNSMNMSHTNDAVLTWLWTTNYLLNASAGAGGSVTNGTNGFYTADSTTSVKAVPGNGYHFAGWTGNVSGPTTNNVVLSLTMDQARTVVAHFSLNPLAHGIAVRVYQYSATLNTAVAKNAAKVKFACNGGFVTKENVCYRMKGTISVKGVIVFDCQCVDAQEYEYLPEGYPIILMATSEDKFKGVTFATADIGAANRLGSPLSSKAKTAELGFELIFRAGSENADVCAREYDLMHAGFGAAAPIVSAEGYDIVSIAGNVVGLAQAPFCSANLNNCPRCLEDGNCELAIAFTPCTVDDCSPEEASPNGIAYGTFMVKYNKTFGDAIKKIPTSDIQGTINALVPKVFGKQAIVPIVAE